MWGMYSYVFICVPAAPPAAAAVGLLPWACCGRPGTGHCHLAHRCTQQLRPPAGPLPAPHAHTSHPPARSSFPPDAEVRRQFGSFGPIAEVKLYRKGAYGFVRFKMHEDAVRAIISMNGQVGAGRGPGLVVAWGGLGALAALCPLPSPAMAAGCLSGHCCGSWLPRGA